MHLRGSRLIYSGAIKVWKANSQASIAPHPPFGRRVSANVDDSVVFQEGDRLSPTTVKVSPQHYPGYPLGSLFTFDVVAFHALFGLLVTADPVIVKVNQMRDNKIIWTGNVRVMLAQKNVTIDLPLGPLGRRDPPEFASGLTFQDGDNIQPVRVKVMAFEHPHKHPGSYFSFDEAIFAATFGSAIRDAGSIFKAHHLWGESQVEYSGNIKVWPANSHQELAPHPPFGRRDPVDFGENFRDNDELEVIRLKDLPNVTILAYDQGQPESPDAAAFDLPPVPASNTGDTSFDLSKEDAGDFGIGDFHIEMDVTGKGFSVTDIGSSYGALFIRSGEAGSPYSGPSVFISSNGNVQFRVRGDEKFTFASALPNPNEVITRHLVFSRTGNTLQAVIAGTKYERTITKQIDDIAVLKGAPLRFRGNHVHKSGQSLYMDVANIVLSPTVPPPKYAGGCYGFQGDFPDNCPSEKALHQGKCGLLISNYVHPIDGDKYFSFSESIFEYVFGSSIDQEGSILAAVHLRLNKEKYTGNVKVWRANSQASIAPHPPIGRLDPFLGISAFQDGDLLKPASVDILPYDRPINGTNTSVPLGTYFTFNDAVFETLFGSVSGRFSVAQMRELQTTAHMLNEIPSGIQEIIYTGDIIVWPANSQEAIIGPHPPYGRREPEDKGPFFQSGDLLKPRSVQLAIYDHPADNVTNTSASARTSGYIIPQPDEKSESSGRYFSFDEVVWSGAAWNAVFGFDIEKEGTTLNAMHLRGSRLIYSGAIKVWKANSQASIAPHPPFGRRVSANVDDLVVFQEGDRLSPTTVKVIPQHFPGYPLGSLFTFDVVAFHALFGLLVTADPVIVKVNQMRDNKIIWTGNVRVMLAQKNVTIDLPLGPLGRRDPPELASGLTFKDE